MALMIFMQKWCWFHFPKYYSFILHYFFLLDSRPALRASAPPCCAAVVCACEQSSCAERRARGCEDSAGSNLLPASRACTESKHFGQRTGRLRPPLGGLGQQQQRETEPWMERSGAAALEKSTRALWAGAAPRPRLTALLGTAGWEPRGSAGAL